MIDDTYLPAPVPFCCSGYSSPHDGHDVNPPCATTTARAEYRAWVKKIRADSYKAGRLDGIDQIMGQVRV